MNEEVRGTLKARARMMGALRRTLEERGFLEVRRSVMASNMLCCKPLSDSCSLASSSHALRENLPEHECFLRLAGVDVDGSCLTVR